MKTETDDWERTLNHWTNWPLRKVLKVKFWTSRYNKTGEGRNEFMLECGHSMLAKTSEGTPSRKRCRDCFVGL
jgi:hypothetical protein